MTTATIWMPVVIGDHLAATGRLTTTQHGAYLLMLLEYWRNGPIRNKDDELAALTRLTRREWSKNKSVLLSFFYLDGDVWRHEGQDAERQKAISNVEACSNRGRKGAMSRWHKSVDKAPVESD